MKDFVEETYMRTFLVIKKENGNEYDGAKKGREYIGAVIESKTYPSTYASENPSDRIVELPKIKDGEKMAKCHIVL